MANYLAKRLLLLLVTLVGITALTFLLTRLTPGDPAAMLIRDGANASLTGAVGYQDLLEQNRRNLGLDRPVLVNWRASTPELLAHQAIDDLMRAAPFWQESARRRLGRVGAIALPVAIERLAAVGTAGERLPLNPNGRVAEHLPEEERRAVLLALLPRLAGDTALRPAGEDPVVAWRDWLTREGAALGPAPAAALVGEYLAAPDRATADAMLPALSRQGGHAVAPLIAALPRATGESLRRVNSALESITGLTFASNEQQLEERADEVRKRWLSWWRRDRLQFVTPGPVERVANVVLDTQFGLWVRQAIALDFGDSYARKRPVLTLIGEALPASFLISFLSIVLSYLLAIPIGILSGMYRHSLGDRVVALLLFVLYSLPTFWVAGILLLTTTGPPFLDWFPARGLSSEGMVPGETWGQYIRWLLDRCWHLVLPVLCLTYGSLAFLSRQMRSALLENLSQDYIRTARAKGASWRRAVFVHAVRNSLIPIITISAGILPELIAGAVIIESIFTIPGMGVLTLDAIIARDYPVINAVLFLSALLTLVGILIADICYAIADPRITYS
jgi:peptide/nickel transport system permease protein